MLHHAYSAGIRMAVSRAIETRDVEYLAVTLFRAGMFAGHTANNPVETAETEYTAWIQSGYAADWVPPTLPTRWQKLRTSLSQFCSTIDATWFNQDKWDMAADIAANVKYIGMVKACFTLGILGVDLACLDTHALVELAGYNPHEKEEFNARTNVKNYRTVKGQSAAIDRYRTLHDSLFPDNARDAQWDTFAVSVPAFAASGHYPVYHALGIA